MKLGVSSAVWLGWLALFGLLEIPAVLHKVPWTTMSRWTWNLEKIFPILPWLVIVALALLLVHLSAGKY